MTKGTVLFKKFFKRKQDAPAANIPAPAWESENWQHEIFQQLEDFTNKLGHIRHSRDGRYPFPLSGSDLIATLNGERYYAWFLSSDYHAGPQFIYMLSNGALVSRQDLYDTAVIPFALQPKHETLITAASKRLRGYLQTEDEQLNPLPPKSQSKKLQQQIIDFR